MEITQLGVVTGRHPVISFVGRERKTVIGLVAAFSVAALLYPIPHVAMWLGFVFAAYSAVANDSIQTIGTFIASNRNRPWWQMWLWIGGIFLLTAGYSWWTYSGDVSYQRLASKGFSKAPTSFHFLQLAAPLFLVLLTRLRMPVSTTFLLLSCFASSGKSIGAVTTKSLSGYVIAFVCAFALWATLGPRMKRWFRGEAAPLWRVGQWLTTGALWSVWLMQDASNIAVYLPRSLSVWEFGAFATVVLIGLAVLLRMGGERIQEVVEEKSHVVDVRAATVIDLLYAIILYIFKIQSKVPMSTTWVFVGLLAGREIAMATRGCGVEGRDWLGALRLAGRDLLYVVIGFLISLVLAALINPTVGQALVGN